MNGDQYLGLVPNERLRYRDSFIEVGPLTGAKEPFAA